MARYRIDNSKRAMMVVVAGIFDLLHFATKLLILFGLTLTTAIIGVWIGNKIGSATVGAWVGGIVGGLISMTGIGTVVALKVGIFLSIVAGWAVTFIGYLVMFTWLLLNGVTIFSGNIGEKMTWTALMVIVKSISFLDLFPGITTWTLRMIQFSRAEDEERAKKNDPKNYMRVERKTAANDNAPEEQEMERYA